jgi:hypothetical protein
MKRRLRDVNEDHSGGSFSTAQKNWEWQRTERQRWIV